MSAEQWIEIQPGRWALCVGGGLQPLAWVSSGNPGWLWHAGHWLGRRRRGERWPYASGRSPTRDDAMAWATKAVADRRASGKPVYP